MKRFDVERAVDIFERHGARWDLAPHDVRHPVFSQVDSRARVADLVDSVADRRSALMRRARIAELVEKALRLRLGE